MNSVSHVSETSMGSGGGPSPPKRGRQAGDSKEANNSHDEEDPASAPAGRAGSGSSSGGGSRGMHIFSPNRPMKQLHTSKHTYTKHFYFKIYANDWQTYVTSTGTPEQQTDIVGFMSWIPWQALCMYLSPNEYMRIVRDCSYAKVVDSKFQLEFKAVRTPFDTNSTDQAEANGNLQFEINRWDGLEKMLPFETVDVPFGGTPERYSTHIELITRLYGEGAFSQRPAAASTAWPATMRERGLTYRPSWRFGASGNQTAFGTMYRDVNRAICALPVGEYVTERLNTNAVKMGEGYCFNRTYKPKNGIIASASTAYSAPRNSQPTSSTRINIKERMKDSATAPANQDAAQYEALFPNFTSALGEASHIDPENFRSQSALQVGDGGSFIKSAASGVEFEGSGYPLNMKFGINGATTDRNYVWNTAAGFTQEPVITSASVDKDNVGYGYNNFMAWYAMADLENYSMFTSRNDPPIHHMPSMLIGAVPKTNKDNTIVNATLEFECTTSITIESQCVDPTYIQSTYVQVPEAGYALGFVDSYNFPNTTDGYNYLFGGKWMHNETDVMLRDPKYWNHNYARAGKPLFEPLPENTPTL